MTASPTISVRIPADSRFVATTRVIAASVAAELDFSIDEIEELRVGANEIVTIVLEWAEDNGGEAIDLTYTLGEGQLELAVAVADRAGDGAGSELDPLARQILGAVVDEFEVTGSGAWLLKRRISA